LSFVLVLPFLAFVLWGFFGGGIVFTSLPIFCSQTPFLAAFVFLLVASSAFRPLSSSGVVEVHFFFYIRKGVSQACREFSTSRERERAREHTPTAYKPALDSAFPLYQFLSRSVGNG